MLGLLPGAAEARLHFSRHTVAPIRHYTNGQRVLSAFKDPMVDIKVPADRRWHLYWHSYSVGDGKVVDHCTVKIDGPGFNPGRELLILD